MNTASNENAKHIQPPSPGLRKAYLENIAQIQIYLTQAYQPSPGLKRPLPETFVQAWMRYAASLIDGKPDHLQRFVDAAAECPAEVVVLLIKASLHLDLIPTAMAQEMIGRFVLELANMPKEGGLHG